MSRPLHRPPSPTPLALRRVARLAAARAPANTQAPANAKACAHHWLLESTTRRGRFDAACRHCGHRRSFPLIEYDDVHGPTLTSSDLDPDSSAEPAAAQAPPVASHVPTHAAGPPADRAPSHTSSHPAATPGAQ